MTDDIDTMSGPELSAAVGREVMGWEFLSGRWRPIGETIGLSREFHPHTDRNDAYRVLMRCEELGVVVELTAWLLSVIPVERGLFWQTLTIDPATICRAALRAVREAKR